MLISQATCFPSPGMVTLQSAIFVWSWVIIGAAVVITLCGLPVELDMVCDIVSAIDEVVIDVDEFIKSCGMAATAPNMERKESSILKEGSLD